MNKRIDEQLPLIFTGIDCGNPLGFLTALGAASLANSFYPNVKFYWCFENSIWRPALQGCEIDNRRFVEQLMEVLTAIHMEPFKIDKKLPFSVGLFETELKNAQKASTRTDRRTVDFLAAFGSEINPKDGMFQDSSFRMARSGDANGRGLPEYALIVRKLTNQHNLYRALFLPWSYRDVSYEDCEKSVNGEKKKKKNIPNFRWDPIDDRRYALRWYNPNEKTVGDMGTEIGANSLAIEALQYYPTLVQENRLGTTGFHRNPKKEIWFTWPIWDRPLSLYTVRSLLALSDLHRTQPPREQLSKRGIVEIYRSQRVRPNQYYSNFTPGYPV